MDRLTLTLRSRMPIGIALGVAAAALIGWLVTSQSGAVTLRDLPADRRAMVIERALANLRDVCGGPDRPRDFCREQAQLVLQLPECGEACRAQARAELEIDTAVR